MSHQVRHSAAVLHVRCMKQCTHTGMRCACIVQAWGILQTKALGCCHHDLTLSAASTRGQIVCGIVSRAPVRTSVLRMAVMHFCMHVPFALVVCRIKAATAASIRPVCGLELVHQEPRSARAHGILCSGPWLPVSQAPVLNSHRLDCTVHLVLLVTAQSRPASKQPGPKQAPLCGSCRTRQACAPAYEKLS